jgi:hypothetical protein
MVGLQLRVVGAFIEAALSVNAGGGSKQKMRRGEDGREGQLEALSKR